MKYFIMLLLVTLLVGCEKEKDKFADCATVLCVADEFYITYKDTNGNPLIGTIFVQDSFKLASPNATLYIKPVPNGSPETLAIPFFAIENEVNYTLQLSESQSDMLQFTFTTFSGGCCVDSNIQKLLFNDTQIMEDSNRIYTLVRE